MPQIQAANRWSEALEAAPKLVHFQRLRSKRSGKERGEAERDVSVYF
jgi:hypothetical protein